MTLKQLIGTFIIGMLMLSGCVTTGTLKELYDENLTSLYRYHTSKKDRKLFRQELVSRHPEWPEKAKEAILKGEVFIGMTKDQARASWGSPWDINKTINQYGVHEQWVYGIYDGSYLYFDNDKLTTIQN